MQKYPTDLDLRLLDSSTLTTSVTLNSDDVDDVMAGGGAGWYPLDPPFEAEAGGGSVVGGGGLGAWPFLDPPEGLMTANYTQQVLWKEERERDEEIGFPMSGQQHEYRLSYRTATDI